MVVSTRGFVRAALVLLFVCIPAGRLQAQSGLAQRLLTPAPVGMNFGGLGYVYSSGNVILDATLPLEDTEVRVHTIAASYVRSLDLLGLTGRLSASAPVSHGEWAGEVVGVDSTTVRNGVGDPLVGLGIALLGAPAMNAAELAGYRRRFLLGTSVLLRIPLGQYDGSRSFNLGTNRWQAVLGVGAALYTGLTRLSEGCGRRCRWARASAGRPS